MQIILISHSQVTTRKSLMDVRDPLANHGHECNYPHFRPMLRDDQPSASTPIDYRHDFLMTCEIVFRYVVNIQLVAFLSNIRALRLPVLILIPLRLASLIPRHHLHVPSSIDFPPSSTDLTTLIKQWNSNRAVLLLLKSLQFRTKGYVWFVFLLSKSNDFCSDIVCCSATRAHQSQSKEHQESHMVDSLHFVHLLCIYSSRRQSSPRHQ